MKVIILSEPENTPASDVELDPQDSAALDLLTTLGYGDEPCEVAEYLIKRGLDDLRRCNVLNVTE